jgi:hypothetical protein
MDDDDRRTVEQEASSEEALFPLYCRHCHRPVPREFSDTHAGLCRECSEAQQRRLAAEAEAREVAAREAQAEAERQPQAAPSPPGRWQDDEFEDAELGLTP